MGGRRAHLRRRGRRGRHRRYHARHLTKVGVQVPKFSPGKPLRVTMCGLEPSVGPGDGLADGDPDRRRDELGVQKVS